MKIKSYSFGSIVVDGKKYTSDIIIHKDQIKDNWWRKRGHRLHLEDLKWVLDKNPSIIIVGKGKYGAMKVPEEVKDKLTSRGIELIIEKTDEACQVFNRRVDSEEVAGALHLAC